MKDIDPAIEKINQLLLDCLHRDSRRTEAVYSADLSDSEWQLFLETAAKMRVVSLLFYKMKTNGGLDVLPEKIQERLRERYFRNAARNLRNFFCLKELVQAMQVQGIPVIVLKGAHLAHTVYPNISVREMSDIDLLVPVEKVEDADQLLLSMGYASQSPWDLHFESENYKHVPVYTKPSSPAVELHFTITNPTGPCRFDAEYLWSEQEAFEMEDATAWGLSPETLLLHICAHAACDHGFMLGLQPFCDIAEIIRRYGHALNWDKVEADAIESGGKRGVYLALLLAKRLLGTKIPEAVFKNLEASGVHERIVAAAMNQVFGEDPLRNFRGVRSEALEVNGFWGKAGGMMGRLFISPKRVARLYGLAPNSLWVYPYYAVRLRDLVRRHGKTVRAYLGGDEKTRAAVGNVAALDRWLGGVDKEE